MEEQQSRPLIDRAMAKALGLKTYFTGVPCARGGVGERRVCSRACLCLACREAAAERDRQYHEQNCEAVTERKRQYYEANREAVAERKRLWREENHEAVTAHERRYREANREALAERARRHYGENREAEAERARRYREENREALADGKRRWHEQNREAIAERKRRWHEKNCEAIAERKRRWREENREALAERDRRYREANPHIFSALSAKRRAAKRERLPEWFSEFDQFIMQEAADLCRSRLVSTGLEWHVDHMVPLRSRKASGLHCGHNLQVIPGYLNLRKNNKLWLHEPDQWLHALRAAA